MRIFLLFVIMAVGPGCTSTALKRATLFQAQSSMDLRYKEVVENLAMVASNPDILPSYSTIFAGTADINDTGKATSTSVWSRIAMKPFRFASFFSTQTADFLGSRRDQEQLDAGSRDRSGKTQEPSEPRLVG